MDWNFNIRTFKSVLILQEVPLHPHSVLKRLESCFEKPSIIHVSRKDELRAFSKPPIYDDRYLVLFEDKRLFEASISYFKLEFMLPVVVCTNKSMTDSIKSVCQDKGIPFVVYVNAFTKDDAKDFIRDLATVEVSEEFCKVLCRHVGLNPQRIISAITVCEQVGYKTSNITKYVDKYVYIDVYDVIESLLHICKSRAQRKRAALYIHLNRAWFHKYTRSILLGEVDNLLKVYRALLDGTLTIYTLQEYEITERFSRYRIIYATDLFERVSFNELLALRQFVAEASVLEIAMRLS